MPVDAAVGLAVRCAGLDDMISATEPQQLYSSLAVALAMTPHVAGRLMFRLLLLTFDEGARPDIGRLQRPRVASVPLLVLEIARNLS